MGLSFYSTALYYHELLDNDKHFVGSTEGNPRGIVVSDLGYSVLFLFSEKIAEVKSVCFWQFQIDKTPGLS
jgi:hypothetical protein